MAASTSLTETQRDLRASMAAHTRWSAEDPAANAARGQAGLLARFEREAREHEPGLTDAEYARRAESARQAHMAGLALAFSKARGARKAGRRCLTQQNAAPGERAALRTATAAATSTPSVSAWRCWSWRTRHACGCGTPADCQLWAPAARPRRAAVPRRVR